MKHMMNSLKTQQDYFVWLCEKIKVDKQGETGRNSYWLLVRDLSKIHFRWTVHNDDNREADGRAIRERYMEAADLAIDGFTIPEVSVLEVLYALAIRIDFDMAELDNSDNSVRWFWMLIKNLELDTYTDLHYAEHQHSSRHVYTIVNKWLDRHFDKHGRGGLFPLKHPKKDQRRVEIWYQKSAYLMENFFDD